MQISLVLAVSQNGVIGKNNTLIWKQKSDLVHFKNLTSGHTIIMGRKTFESFKKPLPNRTHIIISKSKKQNDTNCYFVNSINQALSLAKDFKNETFIIGGGEIYEQTVGLANKIYLTRVKCALEGDTFFDLEHLKTFTKIKEEHHSKDDSNQYDYTFEEYVR